MDYLQSFLGVFLGGFSAPPFPFAFLTFLLGISVGSFLNVVIDRLPRGDSIHGRSHCEDCGETLKALDLVPLVSFFWLRGRCRYCGSSLSYQYPLVEGLTGIVFVILAFRFASPLLLFWIIFSSGLLALFFIDLKKMILPDKIVYPLMVFTVVFKLFSLEAGKISTSPTLFADLLGAGGIFLLFLLIYVLTKGRGMGGGDVKLSFLLAFALGWPAMIVGVYISFILGGAFALLLLLTGKKKFGQAIPFGPFMILAFFITLIFKAPLTDYFLSLFV